MPQKSSAPRRRPNRAAPPTRPLETTPSVLTPRSSKVPAQDSEFLTSPQGQRLSHTDDSLKAGLRGPTLHGGLPSSREDHALRSRAHSGAGRPCPWRRRRTGCSSRMASARSCHLCRVSSTPDESTPVFTRFSTVVGSRGSADTARDVRGFAVKFYTSEGNFDLVGNNIPVFFIP